jgi:hypothetical protein
LAPIALATEVGQIKTLSGDVRIERSGEQVVAEPGDKVQQSDVLVTGPDGRVGITFVDNTRFAAGPDTRVELSRFRFDPTTHEGEFLATIERGTLAVTSGQLAKQSPDQMKVRTPSTVLAVRGTKFLVRVD